MTESLSSTTISLVSQLIATSENETHSLLQNARIVERKRPDNINGLLLRDISREEIAVMESQGCQAENWTNVRVAEDFNPFRVRRTSLSGYCVLGRFDADLDVIPGASVNTGVYDSRLHNCQIGNNCLVEQVRFASSVVVERDVVLFDIGTIRCTGPTRCGCGIDIAVGLETGGREVPLWAEMRVSDAAAITRDRHDTEGLAGLHVEMESYNERVSGDFVWVQRGARIIHTGLIENSFIGPYANIDRGEQIRNVTMYSSEKEPCFVGGGATVIDAILQWGVTVGGTAMVKRSALLEHSAVDNNGMVEESIIGPNTHVEKGEITASLVGPFVGFHHQSLLIAAYWPEGKGNVGYGAMVGSNHTSRAPDQEVWPGEGVFYGLGCSIRFPANYSESPYSVISAGVNTLPQKVSFPFSLISTPALPVESTVVPRAFNELTPAWTLYQNAYGMVRTELKFKKRDQSKRHAISYHVLRPSTIVLIQDALRRLESVKEIKEIYTDKDVEGIGKNFIRESVRLEAIESYTYTLKRYALRVLLAEAEGHEQESGAETLAHEILDAYMPDTNLAARLEELLSIERYMAKLVVRSKESDDQRGARIIPDYVESHPTVESDPIIQSAKDRVRSTEERIKALQ